MWRGIIKAALWLIALIAFAILIFVGIMWVTEYRPLTEEELYENRPAPEIPVDTIKIVSWNIGYAGLGDDMDFFLDGGYHMRTSPERTRENLDSITSFLKRHSDADFFLLQEVDRRSHRSYSMDLFTFLEHSLPEFSNAFFTYNYNSAFVPVPLIKPLGSVQSGLAIFTKHEPVRVVRYGYPSWPAFPVRLFTLKRALLAAEFKVEGIKDQLFLLGNTHNSAYDDGDLRRREYAFVDSLMQDRQYAITMGDWNANPPGYRPSVAELNDPHFKPVQISPGVFSPHLRFVSDSLRYTARYLFEPYNRNTTTRTVLDFALVAPGIECLSIETIDLGFQNSDHNPVIAYFRFIR